MLFSKLLGHVFAGTRVPVPDYFLCSHTLQMTDREPSFKKKVLRRAAFMRTPFSIPMTFESPFGPRNLFRSTCFHSSGDRSPVEAGARPQTLLEIYFPRISWAESAASSSEMLRLELLRSRRSSGTRWSNLSRCLSFNAAARATGSNARSETRPRCA